MSDFTERTNPNVCPECFCGSGNHYEHCTINKPRGQMSEIKDLLDDLRTVPKAFTQSSIKREEIESQILAEYQRLEAENRRLKGAFEYLAEEDNWIEDGKIKRPGGSQKTGIIITSHDLDVCVFAKEVSGKEG